MSDRQRVFEYGEEFATAVFSPDRTYRYELRRRWGSRLGFVLWIMLNPSTADEKKNDPTVRRCIEFTKRWGFDETVVTNLFAFRSTDPKRLSRVDDPIGDVENMRTILSLAQKAAFVVCAWGVRGSLNGRDQQVLSRLKDVSLIQCLGLTKNGHPKHPLYVPYTTELIAMPEVQW